MTQQNSVMIIHIKIKPLCWVVSVLLYADRRMGEPDDEYLQRIHIITNAPENEIVK